MKQLMATLAVAALGVGLVAGAQAQTTTGTINGSGSGTYQIDLTESATTAGVPAGQFGYQYAANLVSNSVGSPIDTFTFNFGNPNETFVSSVGGGYTLDATKSSNGVFFFDGAPGLTNPNDTATFTFASPLPPGGAVAIGTTANNGSAAGGTGFILAPGGAAVPEPATLALLGLGAAPLALAARRRLKG